jgi:hypothetical protein
MKKLIIATSILFAFSSAFAQKPNVKPKVSKYQSKTADAKPSQSTPASSQVKPAEKPVGPSTKPAPVVKPTKAARSVGTSSARASRTSDGTANEKNPAKLETKDNSRTTSNSRASKMSGGTVNEKSPAKLETKDNSRTISNSRASRTSGGTANEKNPAKLETKDNSKTISNSKASQSSVAANDEIIKPGVDYCKGWKDGFSKAFPKDKLKSTKIPNCETTGKCRDYKCGYEAGMKKAEMLLK